MLSKGPGAMSSGFGFCFSVKEENLREKKKRQDLKKKEEKTYSLRG